MKITSFDRNSVDVLCSDIEAALSGVAEKHGVRVSLGKTTYRSNQCSVTIEAVTISPDGEANTRGSGGFQNGRVVLRAYARASGPDVS